VVFMRYVRDELIGSTPTGRTLVNAFNAFYYSWSPPVAQVVSESKSLQAVFRVLLLPLVGIVHVSAFAFATVGSFASEDAASTVAFLIAAFLSVTVYGIPPIMSTAVLKGKLRNRRS
jgi:hypothetical protein